MTTSEIVEDVVARLGAALTDAGAEVVADYYDAIAPDHETPLLYVYVPESTRTRADRGGPPVYDVEAQLVVDAHARRGTAASLTGRLMALAAQVREALLTSSDWLAQWQSVERIDERLVVDVESDERRGRVQLAITLRYQEVYTPAAPEHDLATVRVVERLIVEETGEPHEDPVLEADLALEVA